MNDQFSNLYKDLFAAYKRGDKVILTRSCSDNMFQVSTILLIAQHQMSLLKAKSHNPFYKQFSNLKLMQAKVYSDSDMLMPEDQWAQLTIRMDVHLPDGSTDR